jgi:hypothetical protein
MIVEASPEGERNRARPASAGPRLSAYAKAVPERLRDGAAASAAIEGAAGWRLGCSLLRSADRPMHAGFAAPLTARCAYFVALPV